MDCTAFRADLGLIQGDCKMALQVGLGRLVSFDWAGLSYLSWAPILLET